ncbi:MAG: hypothetical protein CMK98_13740 [Pseudomonas sp.]|nr:hypothetical protein [Pseudomonas sp.]
MLGWYILHPDRKATMLAVIAALLALHTAQPHATPAEPAASWEQYRPHGAPRTARPESGVVTSVTTDWIFVRYGADTHSKATSADCLEWETP